jgi:hypothetical protein
MATKKSTKKLGKGKKLSKTTTLTSKADFVKIR